MENTNDTQNFKQRLSQQNLEDSKSREQGKENSGQYWGFANGDYSKPVFSSDYGTPTFTGVDNHLYRKENEKDTPIGIEKSISMAVAELLTKSVKRPIVVMDFGGGIGTTWCRLAKEFEAEVKKGNLIFVVTNQEKGFDVKLALENNYTHTSEAGDKAVVEYALKNNLIKYIEAEPTGNDTPDVKSLRQFKLQHQGKFIPLIGNVDLINSRMSLIHSLIPEIHYPRVFELMSDQGTFIDQSFSADTPASPSTKLDEGKLINYQTRKPVFNAYQNVISTFNMEPVEYVEDGPKKGEKMFATALRKKNSNYPKFWA